MQTSITTRLALPDLLRKRADMRKLHAAMTRDLIDLDQQIHRAKREYSEWNKR